MHVFVSLFVPMNVQTVGCTATKFGRITPWRREAFYRVDYPIHETESVGTTIVTVLHACLSFSVLTALVM